MKHPSYSNLSNILADCDAQQLASELREFDITFRTHVPEEILLTSSGEPNLRNQYGAILWHVSMLSSILSNFDFRGK